MAKQTAGAFPIKARPAQDAHDLLIAHGYAPTRFSAEGPNYPAFIQYESATEYLYASGPGEVFDRETHDDAGDDARR